MHLILRAMKDAWAHLPAEGDIYCAVSGGLDSMVLLHAAVRYRDEFDPKRIIHVLHVNHSLRGDESNGDELFTREQAIGLGALFHSTTLVWREGEKPSQARCREKRHEFFRSQVNEGGRMFLAHHEDDQAETVLLRLLRGSGLRGLGAMAYAKGPVVRPFLFISRKQLAATAEEWQVKWREDSSNSSTSYERNWLRHEIMPKLERRRPGVATRISALAKEARALPKSEPALSVFDSGEGWSLYRAKELEGFSQGDLSRQFGLGRKHTEALSALLKKKSGKHTAEGIKFHLSAGLVLASRGALLPAPKSGATNEGLFWETALGQWEVLLEVGERAGFQAQLSLGDRAKKEFQREAVPVFFRDQIPLLVREGRPRLLLPGSRIEFAGVKARLSPLGAWWLNPS